MPSHLNGSRGCLLDTVCTYSLSSPGNSPVWGIDIGPSTTATVRTSWLFAYLFRANPSREYWKASPIVPKALNYQKKYTCCESDSPLFTCTFYIVDWNILLMEAVDSAYTRYRPFHFPYDIKVIQNFGILFEKYIYWNITRPAWRRPAMAESSERAPINPVPAMVKLHVIYIETAKQSELTTNYHHIRKKITFMG